MCNKRSSFFFALIKIVIIVVGKRYKCWKCDDEEDNERACAYRRIGTTGVCRGFFLR
jgi:hypothetical protein